MSIRIELQHPGDDGIEKGPVVRDEQHRSVVLPQESLQPGQGIEVEVVGRFVEQQQIRFAGEQCCQTGPCFLATGEFP